MIGFSPRQWFTGRNHPLLEAESVTPALAPRSALEAHLERKATAAAHFHYADARNLLRIAALARARRLRHPEPGQVVYYLRRGRGQRPTYRGPARVIAVEPPQLGTQGISVVWCSHAGVLIR